MEDSFIGTITIDHNDIVNACILLKIGLADYYLEFGPPYKAVYMHWIAQPQDVKRYMDQLLICVDMNLKGKWIPVDEINAEYVPPKFTHCRYILETV